MSNLGFLALGYGFIFVIIAIYVTFMGRRQAALRRQLEQLQAEVDEVTDEKDCER